ncbi:interleukin-8-like [Festucalex cinctus]
MMRKMILSALVVLLALVSISEGMALQSLGVELHCRCPKTESRPIGNHIEKMELIPANSYCKETEIIATLKKTGKEVCLDPEAHWVKRITEKILNNKRL